uniref:CUB domain-containing protein n=1 Tax=Ditylenchus dipsaci TaxID=166011 RepID=A0A915DJ30_9BILA
MSSLIDLWTVLSIGKLCITLSLPITPAYTLQTPPAPIYSMDCRAIKFRKDHEHPTKTSTSQSNRISIATKSHSIQAVLANTEESLYDATLCDHLANNSHRLGLTLVKAPGLARVEFKTIFGVPGKPWEILINACSASLGHGSFNSPRYPANYPLDTNCTYFIFALFERNSKDDCNDYLEVFDVLRDSKGEESYHLQAKHCWTVFPAQIPLNCNGFNAFTRLEKFSRRCTQQRRLRPSPLWPCDPSSKTRLVTGKSSSSKPPVLLQLKSMEVEGEMTEIKLLAVVL